MRLAGSFLYRLSGEMFECVRVYRPRVRGAAFFASRGSSVECVGFEVRCEVEGLGIWLLMVCGLVGGDVCCLLRTE